jgi:hypothetical protein
MTLLNVATLPLRGKMPNENNVTFLKPDTKLIVNDHTSVTV